MSKKSLGLAMAVRRMNKGGVVDKIKSAFGMGDDKEEPKEKEPNYDAPGKPIKDPSKKKSREFMTGMGYSEGGLVEDDDNDFLSMDDGNDDSDMLDTDTEVGDGDADGAISLKSILEKVRKRNRGI